MTGQPVPLSWSNRETWEPQLATALTKTVGASYADVIRSMGARIKYCDDEELILDAFGPRAAESVVVGAIGAEMQLDRREVYAYHAGRPLDPTSYYRYGVRTLTVADTLVELGAICEEHALLLSRADIDAAIASVETKTIEGLVHVALDSRALLEWGGHYLLYGSEFLQSLVMHLPGNTDEWRQRLRCRGRATLLKVRLDGWAITDPAQLFRRMIAEHGYALVRGAAPPSILDWTVALDAPIAPERIESHEHPVAIRDPFNWRVCYD